MEIEIKGQLDLSILPLPKYKVDDKVWAIYCDECTEVTISEVDYKMSWFDNGYISRHKIIIDYDIYGIRCRLEEEDIFSTYEECYKEYLKIKERKRLEDIIYLEKEIQKNNSNIKWYSEKLEKLKDGRESE